MAQTAYSLIKSSLRLINVLAAEEELDTAQANDALQVLNDMIDSWNTDRLAIFTTKSEDFPLSQGKQSYTMGPSGDFNTTRPAQIDAMSAILLNNPSNPVEVPIGMVTVDIWQQAFPVKNVQSSFPQICYDDGGFPLRTLNFWPIESLGAGNNVRIYSWQALTQPATLQTAISFPPGYSEAFRYNLAVRLSGEYSAPLSPSVAQIAAESLARVRTINAPDLELSSDLLPSPAGYNYKADLFGIGL